MKNLVFITSRFPYPLNKGDKLRAYFQIKNLSEFAHIHLISLSEKQPSQEDIECLKPYCKSINNFVLSKPKRLISVFTGLFSSKPFSVSYFYNSKIHKEISLKLKDIKPDIIHCHLIRTSEYANSYRANLMSIDFMDCFSVGALKELKSCRNKIKKLFLRIEYKRLLKYEHKNFQEFDKHFIISQPDKDALPLDDSSRVMILSNGVDFDVFHPKEQIKEYDLLFSGHMGYIPNIAAARYAIKEIVPVLSSKSKLLVAGIGVTPEISNLKNDQVIVQEHFTHIREAFWKSKILLAPMVISIGLQNKLLQAMAMKIPVVCTPQANASINAPVGVAICTATNPKEFDQQIQRLLNDAQYFESIANNAFEYVKKNFDWRVINVQFAKTLLES